MSPTRPFFSVVFALALSTAACGGDKKPAEAAAEAPATCSSNADCDDGLTCLGGECTDTSAKALYDGDSTNAVTPEKVQREVEQRSQQHVDRANDALNAE